MWMSGSAVKAVFGKTRGSSRIMIASNFRFKWDTFTVHIFMKILKLRLAEPVHGHDDGTVRQTVHFAPPPQKLWQESELFALFRRIAM